MKKRILSILLIFLILTTLPVMAYAHDVPDTTRNDCTIDVVLWDNEKNKGIVGAELVCFRVGYVKHDGDYNYHFYDILTNKLIPDNSLQSSTTAAGFAYYAKKGQYKDYAYNERFEKEGVYYFTKLPVGLYIVMQKKAAKGYSDMDPFLVSIPYMEDGEYIYEITAKVKTELKQEIESTPPTVPPTTKPPRLPQTGQLTWPIPALVSGGMLLFALGWWLVFGSKKDSYDA